MKRLVSLAAAFIMSAALVTSCGQKQEKPLSNPAVSQQSENYEDALKECFDASFSTNGGEAFYSYMYPDAYIQDMKDKGEFDSAVSDFNKQQENRSDLADNEYTFGQIKDSFPVTDEQITKIKDYFVKQCAERVQLSADNIDITEGYEVSYTYLKNGKEDGNDAAIAVKISGEGWKVIPG